MRFLKLLHFVDFLSPKVSYCLTPIWLIGLGAALGLIILTALLGFGALLSRVEFFGTFIQNNKRRWIAITILSGLLLAVSIPLFIIPAAQAVEETEYLETFILAICISTLVCCTLAMAVVTIVSRRAIRELRQTMREGVIWYALMLTCTMAVLGIVFTSVVRNPGEILGSLPRVSHSGEETFSDTIPLTSDDHPQDYEFRVNFYGGEATQITFLSSEPVEVELTGATGDLNTKEGESPRFPIRPNEEFVWSKHTAFAPQFPDKKISSLIVRNLGSAPAKFDVTVASKAQYPEVSTLFITAISVVALFLLYLVQRSMMPRVSAIALSTAKSEIAQPMFAILLAVGACLLIVFIWIPYFTLGEDIIMLKNSGLALIMALCIFQAAWASGLSVAEEVEGRTALTVLSKPIGRHSFVLGKFLGIVWTVALMFLVLGVVFLFVVSYKKIYDGDETSRVVLSWQVCHQEMIHVVPGLLLAFMETIVLAAISVAISTRLPMLANFSIVGSIYVLGHLTPLIVQSSTIRAFGMVRFFGQLVATIFPNLESFNIQAAVAGGTPVPYVYLGWSLFYCVLFGGIAMLLALVLFEDRDMA